MEEIKNLKKTSQRILSAIKKNERIILYGDADLDGASSLVLLEEAIKNLGKEPSLCYFPDREKEGYGLNREALQFLGSRAPALLITLDCGIGNFEELALAQKMGFETIVIDHHDIIDKIPLSAIVVDPKQKGDKYHFKRLATVGIVYQLNQLLLGDKLSPALNQSFLELAAIATLADMMPFEDYNRILITVGLKSLFSTFRPGLRAILKIAAPKETDPVRASQKIIPILNISEIKNHLTQTYLLLSSSIHRDVEKIAKDLLLQSEKRALEIREIVSEVSERIEDSTTPFIFEGDPQWQQVVTGSVASRICNKHKKPTFIFKMNKEVSKGSVRAPKDINTVEALNTCASCLEMFGGHPPAAGFTVRNENIEKLRECLANYFKVEGGPSSPTSIS